jgi:putative addiction module component (TIGR02574 family)
MTRAAQTIATEAISLTPTERAEVAAAILDSLGAPSRSDDEVRQLLRQRSEDLASGRDAGLTFEEVFGER